MSLIKPSKTTNKKLPDFPDQKIVLQCTDLIKNNHKFYILELYKTEDVLKTKYGRTGSHEVTEYREGPKIEAEIQWLIKNKESKGYKLVETRDSVAEQIPASVAILNSSLPAQVINFINDICGFTAHYIEENIKTPLGNLTQKQIDKGKGLLKSIQDHSKGLDIIADNGMLVKKSGGGFTITPDQISKDDIINTPKYKQLADLCSEYYSNIPQNFNHRITLYDSLILTNTQIAKQEGILQALQDVVDLKNAGMSINSNVEQKYKSIGAAIEPISAAEFKEINDWFFTSKSNKHNVDAEIFDILKIVREEEDKRWMNFGLPPTKTFHGTKSSNVLGICSRGLLLPGTHSSTVNGAMFGSGIYSAIHSTKSIQYCGNNFRSNSDKSYMFVTEMAMGKPLIVSSTSEYAAQKNRLNKEFNSVWAKAGRDLIHDELIVYNPAQTKLKYIIKFKSKWR